MCQNLNNLNHCILSEINENKILSVKNRTYLFRKVEVIFKKK